MGLDGGLVQILSNFRGVFGTTREVERRVSSEFWGEFVHCTCDLRKMVTFLGAAFWI